MKKIILLFATLLALSGCSKYFQDIAPGTGVPGESATGTYSKSDSIIKVLKACSSQGVPGLVIAVHTSTGGYWGTAAGFSKLETNTVMEPGQLQYLQSISKTYMAVGILRLVEEGKISLDSPVTRYLPARFARCLDRPQTVTVRQLLNHSSGIPEYSDVPAYIAFLLQHPGHSFSSEEFLGYIAKKKQKFSPGSRFDYVNTNYHLLALIADSVYGDHETLIRNEVLAKAGLRNTWYRNVEQSGLVNSYLDRFSTGRVENVSRMQIVSVGCSKGDDGMVATPLDAIRFLQALQSGRLLKPETMKEMFCWVKDENGEPVYGLGLYHVHYAGTDGYGHGGAGIGSGGGLYYFPAKDLYVFLGTNIGTLVDGPIVEKINALKQEILKILLN